MQITHEMALMKTTIGKNGKYYVTLGYLGGQFQLMAAANIGKELEKLPFCANLCVTFTVEPRLAKVYADMSQTVLVPYELVSFSPLNSNNLKK